MATKSSLEYITKSRVIEDIKIAVHRFFGWLGEKITSTIDTISSSNNHEISEEDIIKQRVYEQEKEAMERSKSWASMQFHL